MSKQLIVCASNWSSFVASLKQNMKLGFGLCNKTSYVNGFYRASLEQGTDRAYIARLNSVTGEERENVVDLCDFLGSCLVPFPQELMTRIEELVGKADENKAIDLEKALPKESVATTIKRTRKPRAKK
jgi:hypothetical protein